MVKLELSGLHELLITTRTNSRPCGTEVWIGRTRPDGYPHVDLGVSEDGRHRVTSRRIGGFFMVVTKALPVATSRT